MAEASDIPAWIALFMGLYSLGAAIGEFRAPGLWGSMLKDFERQTGLKFLTGIVCLSVGAAIYLVTPWQPGDWLSVLVTIMGGGMAIEGFVILAFGEPFMRLASAMLGRINKFWAIFAGIAGIALIAVALIRL